MTGGAGGAGSNAVGAGAAGSDGGAGGGGGEGGRRGREGDVPAGGTEGGELGPMADRIAAVVVNYESGSSLATCVSDLKEAGLRELAVVDNGSTDGSLATAESAVPGIEVIVPGGNLGYGAAANRGVAATVAPLVLVCNPDLEVPAGVSRHSSTPSTPMRGVRSSVR